MAAVNITREQLQDLIRGVIAEAAGGAAGAAGTASAASIVGPMGPCVLGRDKLKRTKKWADWLQEAENKMRFGGITEDGRKWDFLRSCPGGELMELWDKEVRVVYKATGEGADRVEGDTYDLVVVCGISLCKERHRLVSVTLEPLTTMYRRLVALTALAAMAAHAAYPPAALTARGRRVCAHAASHMPGPRCKSTTTVVKNTTTTLLKLVNRDRAIIELLRMEQGNRTFNEFLADIKDQTHLCHSWEKLTPEDMKRISLLGGLKDRTLAEKTIAEEYDLKRIIQAAVNREDSRTNAEAIRTRPTGNVHRLEVEETETNIGDTLHGDSHHDAKNKANNNIGDTLHGDHHGAKNKAETNIGDSLHGDPHNGPENKAETNIGDAIHGDHHGAKKKAETDNGDSLHGDSHHGAVNKAETDIGDNLHDDSHHNPKNKAKTNISDSHHGDHHGDHHCAKNKAKTDIGKSLHSARNKAETNIVDTLHDNHHGAKNKAETDISDSLHSTKNKAETDVCDNLHGDSHHDAKNKAEPTSGTPSMATPTTARHCRGAK